MIIFRTPRRVHTCAGFSPTSGIIWVYLCSGRSVASFLSGNVHEGGGSLNPAFFGVVQKQVYAEYLMAFRSVGHVTSPSLSVSAFGVLVFA